MNRTPFKTFLTGLAVLLSFMVGCQSSTKLPTRPMLSGKITYQSKNVPYGELTLVSANGKKHKAMILSGGTYSMARPEAGSYKVSVDTTVVPPAMGGGGPSKGAAKKFGLPPGMEDAEKSGMTVNVAEGTSTLDITVPESNTDAKTTPQAPRKEDAAKDPPK